jgi:hypothetical protein
MPLVTVRRHMQYARSAPVGLGPQRLVLRTAGGHDHVIAVLEGLRA